VSAELRGFLGRWQALEALDAAGESSPALERLQARVLNGLRRRIRAGRAERGVLMRAFSRLAAADPAPYGVLDALLAQLPGLPPPPPAAGLPADWVPYQPSPAAGLLALVQRAGLGAQDRVVDLGSGYGTAALAIALACEAEVVGLEVQPEACDYARRAAEALGLAGRLRYVDGELTTGPLPLGSFYYLYTPLRGAALSRLLGRLEQAAGQRPFRLASLGPGSAAVAAAPWLRRLDPGPYDEASIQLYQTR
jgi:SAM-dependent methyltransferase